MMSAHDVAVAALNEVASNTRSETVTGELVSKAPTENEAGSSIEQTTSINSVPDVRASQNDQTGQSESSINSQSTIPDSTPPTSETYSSQSQDSQSHLPQVATTSQPNVPASYIELRSLPPIATNAGQKRTRDGYAKESGSNSSESPTIESRGHMRNISSISVSSSTASARDLTSELRARLSYAMVKVNHGWESLPIDEVESLASQAGSPVSISTTSTVPGRRNFVTSPRAALAGEQTYSHGFTHMPGSQADPVLYGDPHSTRTYESFWREQSRVPNQSQNGSSLGPAAELSSSSRPQNQRRSHPKLGRPPNLRSPISSDLSQNSQYTDTATAPLTPNRANIHVDTMMHTPTQKTNKERDAIESLLFMSSPGVHANHMGTSAPSSQLQSPLRADFGSGTNTPGRGLQGQRRVEFSDVSGSLQEEARGTGRDPAGRRILHKPRNGVTGLHRLKAEEIDQILDRVDDESSDDEIEIPITPRRLAAGRV